MNAFSEQKIERLIKLSQASPRLPDTFIPWEESVEPKDKYIPDYLVSLYNHPLYDSLTATQNVYFVNH